MKGQHMNTIDTAKIAETLSHDPLENKTVLSTSPSNESAPNTKILLLDFVFTNNHSHVRELAFPNCAAGLFANILIDTLSHQSYAAEYVFDISDSAFETMNETLAANGLETVAKPRGAFSIFTDMPQEDYSKLLIHVLSEPGDSSLNARLQEFEESAKDFDKMVL